MDVVTLQVVWQEVALSGPVVHLTSLGGTTVAEFDLSRTASVLELQQQVDQLLVLHRDYELYRCLRCRDEHGTRLDPHGDGHAVQFLEIYRLDLVVGQVLEAMSFNKFLPRHPNFDREWTLMRAPQVDANKTRLLIQNQLGDDWSPETEQWFSTILGHLFRESETWNMQNLAVLQNFDPGLKTFKHYLTEHWINLASALATKPVAAEPMPIFVPTKHGRVSDATALGNAYPANFSRNLCDSLSLNASGPGYNTTWPKVAHAILSLENACTQQRLNAGRVVPANFGHFSPQDLLRLLQVHVQFSCGCAIVHVDQPMDGGLIQLGTDLLGYVLTVEAVQNEEDLIRVVKLATEALENARDVVHTLLVRGLQYHWDPTKIHDVCQRLVPDQRLRIILCFQ